MWFYRQLEVQLHQHLWLITIALGLGVVVLTVAEVAMVCRVLAVFREEVESGVRAETLGHVQELLRSIRVQRHDFIHHLQAVYGLLEVGAFAEAREYLAGRFAVIASREELARLDNLAVAALLYTKVGMAEARGVSIDLTVEGSLADLPLEVEEANLLIGNLVDNAVEAVVGLPVGQRQVLVALTSSLAGLELRVANHAPGLKSQDLEKLFEAGFSTRPGKQGLGLFSVRQIAARHGGWARADSSPDGLVEFLVWIPARK